MSTSEKGDSFERVIFDLLKNEVENDRMWLKKECCKFHHLKPYYSRDRESDIKFDISIEVFLPGEAESYSEVIFVECKDHGRPIQAGVIEEFFQKIQQVAGAGGKGILASTNSFQTGARNFAKSKGIGLMRYFSPDKFKWVLKRSPSARAHSGNSGGPYEVEKGLAAENYNSSSFDLFCEYSTRLTNSLWDFLEAVTVDTPTLSPNLDRICNGRGKLSNQVPFVDSEEIEALATNVLSRVQYVNGEVPLEAICAVERGTSGLAVRSLRATFQIISQSLTR